MWSSREKVCFTHLLLSSIELLMSTTITTSLGPLEAATNLENVAEVHVYVECCPSERYLVTQGECVILKLGETHNPRSGSLVGWSNTGFTLVVPLMGHSCSVQGRGCTCYLQFYLPPSCATL